MDHVGTLAVDFARLKRIGFRHLKLRADTLLGGMGQARAAVGPEDFKKLLEAPRPQPHRRARRGREDGGPAPRLRRRFRPGLSLRRAARGARRGGPGRGKARAVGPGHPVPQERLISLRPSPQGGGYFALDGLGSHHAFPPNPRRTSRDRVRLRRAGLRRLGRAAQRPCREPRRLRGAEDVPRSRAGSFCFPTRRGPSAISRRSSPASVSIPTATTRS